MESKREQEGFYFESAFERNNKFQRCLRSKRKKNDFDAFLGEELRGRGEDGFWLIQLGRSPNWTGPAWRTAKLYQFGSSSANSRAESVLGAARPFAELDWLNSANGGAEFVSGPARGTAKLNPCFDDRRNSGGIVRDLDVQIGNALVPVDCHVLDIKLNWNASLLLGRAFLSTVGAVCNM
ncbi:hypothetical protein F2Q69_00022958 [Brassica cretica]|uniref:Uncharacterized protein n=1 Tax=Brassica cretica TaxID=69181 RepID=A0A8S9QA61_BRACR|nr:hypothetical protein F2Q69_00022958 [Brassica cretica]